MADPFSNEPIPTDHLPRLSDDAFVPVDPRYLRVSLTGIALTAVVVVVGTIVLAMQIDQRVLPLLLGGGVLLLLMVVAVGRVLEVRRLAYQLREHDLSLRSGVITHRVESLPFSRVQHVNVHRGPIERSLGLATLQVSTAGPDISIPGLTRSDAERIKLLVTERADVVDEDGGAPPPLPPPSPPPSRHAMIDLAVPRRQSPLAIVFLGLRIIRSLGLAQLVILVLFIVRAPFGGALSVVPLVIALAFGCFSVLAWWRYTFQLVDGELVVTKGVIRVVRLNVPVERVQSIAIEQSVLHRLTDLVRVNVDTAGSSDVEFSIDAIPRPVAEELQRRAVTSVPVPTPVDGSPPPPADADDRVIFTHDGRRLLLISLTMSPLAGLLVLGPILALGGDVFDRVPDAVPSDTTFRWWWILVGAAAFVIFSVGLNIVRVFLRDWRLTLRSSATGLRRTSGLLSRTNTASSVERIQVLTSAQNPAQRRAGLRSVELATVGQGDLSLAGCDDAQFATVASLAALTPIDELALDRRVHPAAVFLAVRNTTLVCVVVTAGLSALVGWWSLLVLGVIPVGLGDQANRGCQLPVGPPRRTRQLQPSDLLGDRAGAAAQGEQRSRVAVDVRAAPRARHRDADDRRRCRCDRDDSDRGSARGARHDAASGRDGLQALDLNRRRRALGSVVADD